MKSNNQKGSILGSVLVVAVLVGAVIYYLWSKKDVQAPSEAIQIDQTEQTMQQEQSNPSGQNTEASLETEITELDTDFSDMNSEDLDM